jgi:hypothetical protein
MTTDHSITEMNAAMIALSLSDAAFDQLLTIAGADSADVRVAFDQCHPELSRMVENKDGFAALNFIGTCVVATAFKLIELAIDKRRGRIA